MVYDGHVKPCYVKEAMWSIPLSAIWRSFTIFQHNSTKSKPILVVSILIIISRMNINDTKENAGKCGPETEKMSCNLPFSFIRWEKKVRISWFFVWAVCAEQAVMFYFKLEASIFLPKSLRCEINKPKKSRDRRRSPLTVPFLPQENLGRVKKN